MKLQIHIPTILPFFPFSDCRNFSHIQEETHFPQQTCAGSVVKLLTEAPETGELLWTFFIKHVIFLLTALALTSLLFSGLWNRACWSLCTLHYCNLSFFFFCVHSVYVQNVTDSFALIILSDVIIL